MLVLLVMTCVMTSLAQEKITGYVIDDQSGDSLGFAGLLKVAEEFSGTKAANLAHAYAGLSMAKLGRYDEAVKELDKFSASDLAFNVTYSHDINEYLRGGITVKFLHSKYETFSANAIAADLGVNYYNPDHEVSASIVAKHLGGQIKKFNDKKDPLPWDIQLGVSKTFTGLPLRLSLTAYGLTKWKSPYLTPQDKNNPRSNLIEKESFGSNLLRHLVFGVEILPKDNIYLALGYNYRTRTDMSTYNRNFLSGFSIGAGLRVKAFGFGVALAQPHTGATTMMFNLTTTIGELLR